MCGAGDDDDDGGDDDDDDGGGGGGGGVKTCWNPQQEVHQHVTHVLCLNIDDHGKGTTAGSSSIPSRASVSASMISLIMSSPDSAAKRWKSNRFDNLSSKPSSPDISFFKA